MRTILAAWYLLVAGTVSTPTQASTSLHEQVRVLRLAESPRWHALLHYETLHGITGTHLRSEVVSPEFFLAATGAEDPQAELDATLDAFFLPPGDNPDAHPQCRFVARFQWLRQQLDWKDESLPAVTCAKFREWSLQGQVQSISVVYATGYLSNPASLYGHMLIKFNAPGAISPGGLLDPSTSYGAVVPEDENGLVYITKGLFGGYDGAFSHEKFYRQNHSYAETDLRDLWEYELALSPADVDAVVAHTWELLPVKFRYFFLNRNCAYQVAGVLHLVIDKPLLPDLPWNIPSTVFTRLVAVQQPGGDGATMPLVKSVRRIPSRQNRFYDKFFALDNTQRGVVRQVIDTDARAMPDAWRALDDSGKVRTLETLFDYYEYRGAAEMNHEHYQVQKTALLRERFALPAMKTEWPQARVSPPHDGLPPFLVQFGLQENSLRGGGAELRLRPAYYDILSLHAGRVPDSALSMLDTRFLIEDGHVRLRSLEIASIDTLNLSRTHLPGDGGMAWSLRVGVEQQDLACVDCTAFRIELGAGKAMRLRDDLKAFALLDVRAQDNVAGAGHLALSPRAGLLYDPESGWQSVVSFAQRRYVDGNEGREPVIRWENRFGNGRHWDIRAVVEKNVAREARLAAAWYW